MLQQWWYAPVLGMISWDCMASSVHWQSRPCAFLEMATSYSSCCASTSKNSATACPAVSDSESDKLVVLSLLSRLKQVTLSSLNRKKKVNVAQNLPHVGKRRKPYWCSSEPRSVTTEHRVREFPHEALVMPAKKLFYTACIEELAWWQKHATEIPGWFHTACKVILAQPSSAAAERVFSLLNCFT